MAYGRRRLTAAVAVCAAAFGLGSDDARANGRRPTTVNVFFHPTDNQRIYIGASFGLLVSVDDGANFNWVCEEAACPSDDPSFNGCDTFDPVYAIGADGTIFNTTIFGLHVSRDDACTFDPVQGPLAGRFTGDVQMGSDGAVWALTADGTMPNDVYRSTDNGMSWDTLNNTITPGWWESLRVSESDPNVAYLSGFVPAQPDGGGGLTDPQIVLYRTANAGQTWDPLPTTSWEAGDRLLLEVVSPTDPNLVFARVRDFETGTIWRSADGGQTWASVLTLSNTTVFPSDPAAKVRIVARADGQTYLAGSPVGGLRVSTDAGLTWNETAVQPMTWCIGERGDGTLFACSENFDPDQTLDPSVRFALGRSTDGNSWTKVFRFVDLREPRTCGPDTANDQVCLNTRWCSTAELFGIDACDAAPDAGTGADGDDGTDGTEPPDEDCGNCGGCSIALAGVFFLFPFRRRRRR